MNIILSQIVYSDNSDEAEEVPVKEKKVERKQDEFKENIMLLAKEEVQILTRVYVQQCV